MGRKLTTEEFVEKAISVHGGKYSYENLEYVNNKTKVSITCQKHGEFLQQPQGHLAGKGCKKCAVIRDTTESFITKSRTIHGNKYSYKNVDYVNTTTKVSITCQKHGEFLQRPQGHLSGRGCSLCRIDKISLTTNSFIEKSHLVHGNTYSYENVVYKGSNEKVEIKCSKHGYFLQRASTHLSGSGCRECNEDLNRSTNTDFIQKAIIVHGNTYSYNNLIYTTNNCKVSITCPEHGDFLQIPSSHLSGIGCPVCGGTQKRTTRSFIEKARKVHKGKYTYNNSRYINNKTKIFITCYNHGDFLQQPSAHLSGYGCTQCGVEAVASAVRYTTNEFIQKASVVHNNKYSYENVVYKSSKEKVPITCTKHGVFVQTPSGHLTGYGCPSCSSYTSGTKVYLTEFQSSLEHFAKIGVMKHDLSTRFSGVDANIVPHFVHDFEDSETAREVEQGILTHLRDQDAMYRANLLEGNGSTETFKLGYIPDVHVMLQECISYSRKNKITREKVIDMCST